MQRFFMNISLSQQLKQGKDYIDLWPERPELNQFFQEYKAIIISRFVLKYCPALALFALILPLMTFGLDKLSIALAYAMFIASMPVQALFFMSKKAKQKLPLALASWYRQAVDKINQQATTVVEQSFSVNNPTYNDLAKLLHYSYTANNNH